MLRRVGALAMALAALAALLPPSASAHGLVSKPDVPIPAWLFGVAAAVVLLLSFGALAFLWKRPKLEVYSLRTVPDWLSRAVTSRVLEIAGGAIGVFLLLLCIVAGFAGTQSPSDNFTPSFVYVIFWVALVPASVLFGNVFGLFNPWLAIGRAVRWSAVRLLGDRTGTGLDYPAGLGRWPAAAGLVAWAWFELASSGGPNPRNLAAAAIVYSSMTFLGMGLYGVDAWTERGEAFSVYFGLFARISVWERHDREVFLRPPLAGLTRLDPVPGTVATLAVMIGTVTYDGSQESIWVGPGTTLANFFSSLGASPSLSQELAAGVGIFTGIAFVAAFYLLAIAGASTVGGGYTIRQLAGEFVHSLVPIALVYVLAHYFTFLLFQSQAMAYLISDPLGNGWNLFGTYDTRIDYNLITATQTWYFQVAFVVLGHVAGLMLAHDRALVLYENPRQAVRSQWFLLAVMIVFTSLALYLLSRANA